MICRVCVGALALAGGTSLAGAQGTEPFRYRGFTTGGAVEDLVRSTTREGAFSADACRPIPGGGRTCAERLTALDDTVPMVLRVMAGRDGRVYNVEITRHIPSPGPTFTNLLTGFEQAWGPPQERGGFPPLTTAKWQRRTTSAHLLLTTGYPAPHLVTVEVYVRDDALSQAHRRNVEDEKVRTLVP